jgi:hypothetical protein
LRAKVHQDLQHIVVSLKSGTRWRIQGSRVKEVAARIGNAEFFDPLIFIEPESERPP